MPNTIYVSQTATTSGGITFGIGSDANPGTNPASPKLTLDTAVTGAIAAATTGDTIIVNDGTYTAATFFSIANKNLTINPATAGMVVLKRTGAVTRVLNIDNTGGTCVLGALILDAENNSTTSGLSITSVASLVTITLNGTIIRNVTGSAGIAINSAKLGLTCNNVNIQVTDSACIRTLTAFTDGSYLIVQQASYLNSTCTNVALGTMHITTSAATGYLIVRDSELRHTNTGSNTIGCIHARNTRCLIERNKLYVGGSSTGSSLIFLYEVAATAVLAENSVIRNNYGVSAVTGGGGYLCGVGADTDLTTGNYQTNYPAIYGNVFIGNPAATLLHGIFLGFCSGGVVSNNLVLNAAIPFISKQQNERSYWVNNATNLGTASTSGMLRAKGTTKATFVGNTVKTDATCANWAMLCDNDTATNSTGCDFIANNIRVAWTATKIDRVAASSDAEFLFNNYEVDGYSGTPFNYGASTYADLTAWAAQEKIAGTRGFAVNDPWANNKMVGPYGSLLAGPIGGSPPWGA